MRRASATNEGAAPATAHRVGRRHRATDDGFTAAFEHEHVALAEFFHASKEAFKDLHSMSDQAPAIRDEGQTELQ